MGALFAIPTKILSLYEHAMCFVLQVNKYYGVRSAFSRERGGRGVKTHLNFQDVYMYIPIQFIA